MIHPRNDSRPDAQRAALLNNKRQSHAQPGGDEATTKRAAKVDPDGTGPSQTDSRHPKAQ